MTTATTERIDAVNAGGGPLGTPVEVRGLIKRFGDLRAIDNVNFEVAPGKILALLGPSGCGKTTTLRCVAGLEWPDDGDILVGSRPVTSVARNILTAPNDRDMGMVFQSYAIWPHMTVAQNVGYPLKVRRVARAEIARRVDETLELIGLGGLQDRPASKLSGGQQQRVALARAIINRPRVLLLDEPLSNLDAKLRARMRFELLRLQREVGITSIFVTHDQTEAMAIADELIVMRQGRIEQRGDARSLYLRPVSVFVADFIGGANFLSGELVAPPDSEGQASLRLGGGERLMRGIVPGDGAAAGSRYAAVVRPEAFKVHRRESAPAGCLQAKVLAVQYLGSCLEARAEVSGTELRVTTEPSLALASGDLISLQVAPEDCVLLPDRD